MQPNDTARGDRRFPSTRAPGSPEGIGAGEVDARSELAKWVSGTHAFPSGKKDLLERAESQSAPDAVLAALRALPDRSYENMEDVARQLGPGGTRLPRVKPRTRRRFPYPWPGSSGSVGYVTVSSMMPIALPSGTSTINRPAQAQSSAVSPMMSATPPAQNTATNTATNSHARGRP
ncbi:DUF2795 domain-containing protein [Sphaerisporangium sp. B11E5]|uniref:DUF2795 domain-containing protein n=1 Tax=Sphaerisporangium sp. B11E5 TaxID=3153563 RepID=UPI00325CAD23